VAGLNALDEDWLALQAHEVFSQVRCASFPADS
jgi:hypothetical protein